MTDGSELGDARAGDFEQGAEDLPESAEPSTAQLEARLAAERAAEVETPDTGGDDTSTETDGPEGGEGDAEPDEAAPPAEPAAPAGFDEEAFEREQRRHEKAVRRIAPEGMPLVACDACGGVGFTPPGSDDAPELLASPDHRVCDACAGYGAVLTGSKVETQSVLPCPRCQGNGHVPFVPPQSPAPPANGAPPSWMGETPPAAQPAPYVFPYQR